MKRREFLATLGIGLAATPFLPLPDLLPAKSGIATDFVLGADKTIRYVGNGKGKYTVLELHRWLSDLADEPGTTESVLDIMSDQPSVRHTDEIIELLDGWRVEYDTAAWLDGGTIIQRNGKEMIVLG